MSTRHFTTPRGWLAVVAILLMLPLAGCRTKVVKAAVAPAPPPIDTVSVPPPSHPTEPLPPEPVVEVTLTPAPVIPPPRIPPPRRRPTPPPPQQTAAAAPPPIDLGQLTAGNEAGNTTFRQQTEDLMKAQNRRLITIPSAVSVLHAQQVEQARLFLRQADEAWKKLDIEGAHTLATKAKVLLDEIAE
jgi:hypothetical protein